MSEENTKKNYGKQKMRMKRKDWKRERGKKAPLYISRYEIPSTRFQIGLTQHFSSRARKEREEEEEEEEE